MHQLPTSIKDFADKQRASVRKDVIPEIKRQLKPKGSQLEKTKALRKFALNNAPTLLTLVKNSPGINKIRTGPLANVGSMTPQGMVDYILGKDLDLSTKKGKNALNSRKDKLAERIADGLAEEAWVDAIDRDTNAQAAVQELQDRLQDDVKESIKPDLKYDNVDVDAFQESQEGGDAEAQGGSIEWIWKEVLGQKDKLKRTSEETRTRFKKEALDAAAAGLIPPWLIEAVTPAAAGGKGGIPRRGGMFTSVTDPDLVQLLEVAEANWKGDKHAPQRVPINELSLTKVGTE